MKNCLRFFSATLLAITFLPQQGSTEVSCKLAQNAFSIASQLRGLAKKREVHCELQNRDQVEHYLKNELQKKAPQKKIRAEAAIFNLLGLIPPDFDYVSGLIKLYTDQLGGYYDPEKKSYVMAAWMPEMMQMTIAVHELTHALQDQYFDLKHLVDPENATNDEQLARSALVEGDATAVMIDYSRSLFGQGSIATEPSVGPLMAQNILGAMFTPALQEAPSSIRSLVLFPYVSGLNFAHALLKRNRYKEIDRAFSELPRTTEEILHPEKYGAQKDYEIPPLPTLEPDAPPNERIADDTLGEFTISALLSTYLPPQVASSAAAGWAGDRVAVFQIQSGGQELRWLTRWDTDTDAQEFYRAIVDAYKKRFELGGSSSGDETVFEKSSLRTTVKRERNQVAIYVSSHR